MVPKLIIARTCIFLVEIDHEINSTVILVLLLIQEGLSVTSKSMCTSEACPEIIMIRLTDHLDMTIAIEWHAF